MSGMNRVTYSSLAATSLRGMQNNLERYSRSQERLSSGTTISRPSDDPTGTVNVMTFRADIAKNKAYSDNADDGGGWLSRTDKALQDVDDQLNTVKNAALQGRSTGSSDSSARNALAIQVDQLRKGMIDSANTNYLGRPVFGGTTSGSVAYDKTTGAYVGDAGSVTRTVGQGDAVRVDTSGDAAFGTGTDSLFSVVSDISDHLKNNPDALDVDLARLDKVMNGVRQAQADVGARTNRIESQQMTAKDRIDSSTKSQSEIEGVDIPAETINLSMQQVSYQAALSTASKVLQLSLNNFLR